jgi:hypothetical protein
MNDVTLPFWGLGLVIIVCIAVGTLIRSLAIRAAGGKTGDVLSTDNIRAYATVHNDALPAVSRS